MYLWFIIFFRHVHVISTVSCQFIGSLICICPISGYSFVWCDVANFTTSQWIIGSTASWGNRITTLDFYWKCLERGEGTKYLAFRTGYNELLSFEIGLLCARSLSLSKSAHRLWFMIIRHSVLWHENASPSPFALQLQCISHPPARGVLGSSVSWTLGAVTRK